MFVARDSREKILDSAAKTEPMQNDNPMEMSIEQNGEVNVPNHRFKRIYT